MKGHSGPPISKSICRRAHRSLVFVLEIVIVGIVDVARPTTATFKSIASVDMAILFVILFAVFVDFPPRRDSKASSFAPRDDDLDVTNERNEADMAPVLPHSSACGYI